MLKIVYFLVLKKIKKYNKKIDSKNLTKKNNKKYQKNKIIKENNIIKINIYYYII